jgi:GT2 family glycosyltransferase
LPEQANPEPPPPKVSIVVTSHNRAALLRRCLEALEASEDRASFQIIVVDNGSTDGSTAFDAEFPNIRFMRLPRNFGLTKALNIGIRAAEADYLFLLHEDTEVSPQTARELAAALDASNDVGAVCPLLVTPDGRPAPQVAHFPPSGIWQPAPAATEPIEVDYAKGAALMFRSFFFKAMRQIDERYGQFGSDAELCFQIRRSGKKILILPSARTVHHGRAETSSLRTADFRLGAATFISKHAGFLSGAKARLAAISRALGGLRFGELVPLISGQKIDGTQS